ncbi:MAG: hypothetical protein JW999_10125 [Methanotrichaceae archaeon]|nr:hypothetical protein [Methanotrichaceae archaeon]
MKSIKRIHRKMRFGNGRDGLNIGPGEMTGVKCSDFGHGSGATFLTEGSKPAYSQECLPKAQARRLLSSQGDIKGFDYNTFTSF